MKFLCVPCDTPMELGEKRPVAGGTSSLVFGCPDCGYEIAMRTNPHETRLMNSVGAETEDGTDPSNQAAQGVLWTAGAERRMQNVPDLVKPMVRSGIERFARQQGYEQVNERVLDEARDFFEGAGFSI